MDISVETKALVSRCHKHSSSCGHTRVAHSDHHDYRVDNVLHHQTREGECEHHELRLCHDKDAWRFRGMFVLTGAYFIIELVYGLTTGSLALIADSVHMLSDLIALLVGFYSLKVARRSRTDSHTFGWTRMEVIGGLMNGTFLLAICFFILLEAIQRLAEGPNTSLDGSGYTILTVACIGLGVNVLGVCLFGGHAGGHGHSHGGKGKSHGNTANNDGSGQQHGPKNLNMHAIFLHALGDAVGSIGVIITALVIKFASGDKRFLVDPISSMLITVLLMFATVPMMKKCIGILLQQVPAHLSLPSLRTDLSRLDGIREIHELHIWQLNNKRVVGSVHATLGASATHNQVLGAVKGVMHRHGVHSSAVQLELDSCQEPNCAADCSSKSCCPEE